MRLALVTETYPPEVNGVAMTLSRLVGGLRARGHEVEVVRPRQRGETGEPADLLVAGVPIPRYEALRMGLPSAERLARRWESWGPEVVHVATEGPLGLAALRAAGALGLPVTSSFHTNFHSYGGHYGLRALREMSLGYLRWFHNRTRLTLVPTRRGAEELAAQGFERTGVMGRGVDTGLFHPRKRDERLRAEWGAGPEDPVALYVGRVAAEKNLGLVVDTVLGLRRRVPGLRFVLVGDGPERAGLAAKYPEFHYAGMRRGEELAAHYASADLFLFASVTETFGNVVTEAMASGLATVTYDYAATREHVRHGENGYAAAFNDGGEFVRVAEAALAARGEWPEVRRAARATAEGVTWEAVVARFEADVKAAAKGDGGRGRRGVV